MALRVARIPYLHAEPFYCDMERRGLVLYEMVPSAVAAALLDGEIDAGLVPVVDGWRYADRLQPVAGFCIATVQRSSHIFLYANQPIDTLSAMRIGVTSEAVTAVRLLDMLLQVRYGQQPSTFVTLQDTYDAFLLIGNDGVRRRGGERGYAHTYDLGAEWHAWTGLPLVTSRWMARQDIDPKAFAVLQDTLYVGLEVGVDAIYRIGEPRDELRMMPRDITRYIRHFRYFLKTAELQALEQFQAYMLPLEADRAPAQG